MPERDRVVRFVVGDEEDSERLDRLVMRHAGVSRRIARVWITQGRIRLRGKTVKIQSRTVRPGTRVSIDVEGGGSARRSSGKAGDAERPTPRVLHLDSWLVAVDKPAGLLSEPDRVGSPSVLGLLPGILARRGEKRLDLWLVHRLDAGTSGVLILARRATAAARLSEAFARGQMNKTYLALCSGVLKEPRLIDAAIARGTAGRQQVSNAGKSATTQVDPLAVGRDATLIRAKPRTGRTHQIRVHLAHIGHPLLGDRLYGGPGYFPGDPPEPVGRAMLHAVSLALRHPKTGALQELRAPVPGDFRVAADHVGIQVTDT